MARTIELTPTAAAQLTTAARQAGLEPAELARKFVTEPLPPVTPATPEDLTLALFAQWDADDAQMTPEDIAEAQRDYDAFTQRMNAESTPSLISNKGLMDHIQPIFVGPCPCEGSQRPWPPGSLHVPTTL